MGRITRDLVLFGRGFKFVSNQVKMLCWNPHQIACASQESLRGKSRCGDGASELTEIEEEDVKTVPHLPRELLHLMFTPLPMERIGSLQFLNKDWKQALASSNSDSFTSM